MQILNRADRYGLVAIVFHWVIAVLILGMLALGLYMSDLAISPAKLKFYGWHKEYGILILMLAVLRILWRMLNCIPALPDSLAFFQKIAARFAHYAFYFFLFAMPLTGWMMSSAAGVPVSFFGLFVLPDLVSANKGLSQLLANIHGWMAYALMALIVLHVVAALQHHFYYKDDVLKRMLP